MKYSCYQDSSVISKLVHVWVEEIVAKGFNESES